MLIVADFEPWAKYPDLKRDYLTVLANLIRDVRRECADFFEPEMGDGRWSLGCRVYERTFNRIRRFASTVDWLTINPELHPLKFSFSIGAVPLRVYKGDPEDPPTKYLNLTEGEYYAHQTCFDFEGLPQVDVVLRLAVDVDSEHHAAAVYLVEIDEAKVVTAKYRIPFGAEHYGTATPMQAPPVTLPPVTVLPIEKTTIIELPKVAGNANSK